jgi:hypothetical protein
VGSLSGGDSLVHLAVVDPFIPFEDLLDIEGDLFGVVS